MSNFIRCQGLKRALCDLTSCPGGSAFESLLKQKNNNKINTKLRSLHEEKTKSKGGKEVGERNMGAWFVRGNFVTRFK